MQAVAWNKQLDKVTARGYKIATVSYDSINVLSLFASRRKIKFTLLSDQGSKIIRAFGLLNENHPPGSAVHGIAHPTILVVDSKGKVTANFAEANYSRRPDLNQVLKALGN
ncbi:MAG: peroxiredoxin family protein [Alphaproteobacteria bacterium]|nr:peroxiredoxin family protein [Alphaproteobacteria bacterium]